MRKKKLKLDFWSIDFEALAAERVRRIETKRKRAETMALRELTVPESMHRLKFSMVNKFLSQAKEVVRMGYAKAYRRRELSEINLAVRVLLRSAIVGVYPDYRLDFPKIAMSVASGIGPVGKSELFISKGGKLKVTWSGGSGSSRLNSASDEVVFYIYNERTGVGEAYFDVAKRDDLSFEIGYPFDRKGDVIHCWIFMVTRDRGYVSKSEYMRGVV